MVSTRLCTHRYGLFLKNAYGRISCAVINFFLTHYTTVISLKMLRVTQSSHYMLHRVHILTLKHTRTHKHTNAHKHIRTRTHPRTQAWKPPPTQMLSSCRRWYIGSIRFRIILNRCLHYGRWWRRHHTGVVGHQPKNVTFTTTENRVAM